MMIIKIIGKIVAVPVWIATVLIQWIGIFLNSFSSIFLNILSFIFVLTGITSLLFGLVSGREAAEMIVAGFALFIIPHAGNWVIERIGILRCILSGFIRS